jgi:hypothetical protein
MRINFDADLDTVQGTKPMRIRILVRLLSHKKLHFYMKNVRGTGTVLEVGKR